MHALIPLVIPTRESASENGEEPAVRRQHAMAQFSFSEGVVPNPRAFTSGARACPELVEGDLPLPRFGA
jgi:hypothetical protein